MKTIHCRDAGFDCEQVVRGETEEEVINAATRHAKEVHGLEANPEMSRNIRGLIREE
ncbi:DUF1059 domain-containing protein [Salegentibacter sp. HM20]